MVSVGTNKYRFFKSNATDNLSMLKADQPDGKTHYSKHSCNPSDDPCRSRCTLTSVLLV